MNKNQLLALAAFITSLANDACGEFTKTENPPAGGEAPPVKRRGRPPTTAAPPPTEPEKTEEPRAGGKTFITPPPSGDEEAATGKTYEEMRALIEPLIKAARGPEVKPIITKYAATLKDMDPKDYPAFEKDIEALLY